MPTDATNWTGGLDALRARMSTDLKRAMRARDRPAVNALRTALGALDNAEAVPVSSDGSGGGLPVRGLRATEAARRALARIEVVHILRAELDERRSAAATYRELGQLERAHAMDAEAAALAPHVDFASRP